MGYVEISGATFDCKGGPVDFDSIITGGVECEGGKVTVYHAHMQGQPDEKCVACLWSGPIHEVRWPGDYVEVEWPHPTLTERIRRWLRGRR